MAADVITFEDFEVDLLNKELRRGGVPVPLEPKALDLIGYLAHRPGELVTKDDLVDAVWEGRAISDSAISSCIAAARAAVADDGTAQRVIRTVPRRGLRFEARVCLPEEHTTSAPVRDRPSVAVLPFRNMSADPEQTYFSDGITDDIITDLSRYRELFVIAGHSSFAYRASDKPMDLIARELGVQYLAEGSVRRVGNRIRITVRLSQPDSGEELWSERYDRELTDIFEVQDEISSVIVNRMVGQIARQHHRRIMDADKGATAYDCLLRAQTNIFMVGRDVNRRALADVKRALELEPTNARAHAMLGWYYVTEGSNSWGLDAGEAFDAALHAAQTAIRSDDREPFAAVVLAWVYLWRDRDHDRAIVELHRALAMNPGSAAHMSFLAFAQIYAGQHEDGKANLEGAMQLNPHFSVLYDNHYMRALFHLGQSEAALHHAERVRLLMPQASNALSLVAAIHASLDRLEDARAVVERIRAVSPGFTRAFAARYLPYRRDEDRSYYLKMLAKSGLPSGD